MNVSVLIALSSRTPLFQTPVVMVAFNRPHLVERTLAAVRAVQPREMFLLLDGPRADRPEDIAACEATRDVFDGIDWPCQVHRRVAEFNLGLEANVELGLDWVFDQTGEAIVLEDDCVAHPSFFRYSADLLDRYREDRRIWQISGSSLGVPRRLFGEDSYAFTSWASVWGWATWADRWKHHRENFHRDHRPEGTGASPIRRRPAQPRPGLLVTRSGQRHFAETAASLDTDTHGWDKHWWLSMLTEGALAVSPAANLVENVGWGPDATHTNAPGGRDHPVEEMSFPLRHPDCVELHVEVERDLELALGRVGSRAAVVARRFVRSPRLRRLARRVVHSRGATSVARTVSRLPRRTSDA